MSIIDEVQKLNEVYLIFYITRYFNTDIEPRDHYKKRLILLKRDAFASLEFSLFFLFFLLRQTFFREYPSS